MKSVGILGVLGGPWRAGIRFLCAKRDLLSQILFSSAEPVSSLGKHNPDKSGLRCACDTPQNYCNSLGIHRLAARGGPQVAPNTKKQHKLNFPAPGCNFPRQIALLRPRRRPCAGHTKTQWKSMPLRGPGCALGAKSSISPPRTIFRSEMRIQSQKCILGSKMPKVASKNAAKPLVFLALCASRRQSAKMHPKVRFGTQKSLFEPPGRRKPDFD